ncbi:MAG: TlpA disulfide reductase family protein [Thermodesulfobacteriota bacterium]
MEEKEKTENGKKGSFSPAAVVIVAVAVVGVSLAVLGQRQQFVPVVAGTKAIEFTLPDLGGGEVTLSDYRGKVVFLNFWATWCKPCEEEMPSMQELYDEFKGQPFEMLAVSVDSKGPEAVSEFIEKRNFTFPVLHDRKGRMKERYKTTGVPETFIIDQNGVIAEKVMGPRDWSRRGYTSMVRDLLKNGAKPPEAYRTKRGG